MRVVKIDGRKRLIEESSTHFPVDTGRKLKVYKTFKRRPGRLLNALCTFNLRPVCAGLLRLKADEPTIVEFHANHRGVLIA